MKAIDKLKRDLSAVLLSLEPAAHMLDGMDSEDPRLECAKRQLDEAIYIIEELCGTTHEAIECDRKLNELHQELLGR